MWSQGDRVLIRVPAEQRERYPKLHLAKGVVDLIPIDGERVHVALDDGGAAVLDPRWLYVPSPRRSRRSGV